MSRLPVLSREELDAQGQGSYDRIAASPVGVRTFHHLLYSPELAERYVHLTNFFREASVLSLRMREFATLVAARQWDSQYIWAAHEAAAERAGVAAGVINAIKNRVAPKGLDEADGAVFHYVQELLGRRRIADGTFEALAALLGPRGVVELTVLVGYYTMQAHTLAAFEIAIPEGGGPRLPN
jgi:4-carboxymuconolactone decarboxylase